MNVLWTKKNLAKYIGGIEQSNERCQNRTTIFDSKPSQVAIIRKRAYHIIL